MNISFDGRLNRQPYIIASIIVNVISAVIGYFVKDSSSLLLNVFAWIVGFLLCIFSLSLLVRRLHDLNKSGWFALVMLIPIVDVLFWLYTLIARGTEGSNKYGEDPLQAFGAY